MNEIKKWGNHTGPILDFVKGFDVIECVTCGFKHIVPIPTQEELETIYRDEYYSKEKPLYLKQYREDLDWWNLVYSDRYDIFEEYLQPDRRRILDVGSGPGLFLLHGKQRGWRTLGIEPSAQAAAHSCDLGVEIVEDFLTEASAGKLCKFDVVHMSEVLEHIPDPTGMLELTSNLLTPGGLICVVVPNDYNPFQKVLREKLGFQPYWLAPPHHINYFTFDSLKRLLERTGFKILHTTAMFPMEFFLLMGDNYVCNDILGRACHTRRKKLDILLNEPAIKDFKRDMYKLMARYGIGREMVIYSTKGRD